MKNGKIQIRREWDEVLFVSRKFSLNKVFIWLVVNGHHPLLFVLFSLCYFFYRFSHTYAQAIGLSDMHSLSVRCRRFDTFELLLPFNGPIKLFHSHPFDQSDAAPIGFLFSLSLSLSLAPQGDACPLILTICSSDCASEQYTLSIKISTNQSVIWSFSFLSECPTCWR